MEVKLNTLSGSPYETPVRLLYKQLLHSWNEKDAEAMASLFIEEGTAIGFDGSQMSSRQELRDTVSQVFSDHQTSSYVGIIRDVTFLTPTVALVRAVAGMVPPGSSDINPAVNAVQSMVALKQEDQWLVALFQNTPAAFHGRPELAEQLTEELRKVYQENENQ